MALVPKREKEKDVTCSEDVGYVNVFVLIPGLGWSCSLSIAINCGCPLLEEGHSFCQLQIVCVWKSGYS